MSGQELYTFYHEGKGGSRMSNMAYLLDQACNWDMDKAKSILEDCVKKGYKLKTIYQGLNQSPDPEDIYIGEIIDGGLYLTSSEVQ